MGVYNVIIKDGNRYHNVPFPDAEAQKRMYANANPSSGESVFTARANFPKMSSAFDTLFKNNL